MASEKRLSGMTTEELLAWLRRPSPLYPQLYIGGKRYERRVPEIRVIDCVVADTGEG